MNWFKPASGCANRNDVVLGFFQFQWTASLLCLEFCCRETFALERPNVTPKKSREIVGVASYSQFSSCLMSVIVQKKLTGLLNN
jgi:hypothetical protein